MKISVITVCYNSAETIEDTIKSVISQDYPNLEYLIIDGGSTDNTKAIINKYSSKVSVFISEKDKGMYDAINKGIDLATGDIIAILNSDDLYADETVLAKVSTAFKESEADAVYGDLYYVDRNDTDKVFRYWKSGKYKEGLFFKGWMPPHPAFFVKKEIYRKYGVFNLSLKSAADYELMLRFIQKHEISVSYLPHVLVKMRTGGKSNVTLKNRIKANKEDRLAWKINDLKPKWYTLWLKPISKVMQFFKKS